MGKSELADHLAASWGGEVVSADSMQVYRGLDIGTAKTAPRERSVPYHCLDLVDPGEPFSAALYQVAARTAIDSCLKRGRTPVVCGGTGLYVRAALDDLDFPPGDQVENPSRRSWETFLAEHGPLGLHGELERLDPASAALIHPNNSRRVVRALELVAEGLSYADRHSGLHTRVSVYETAFIGLTMERDALYSRIDMRVDRMMERGLLGEVTLLLERGCRDALTAMQAIGYKELIPVLDGERSLEEAVELIKRSSRRYAKRQLTWFGADERIRWIDVTESSTEDTLAALHRALESGT